MSFFILGTPSVNATSDHGQQRPDEQKDKLKLRREALAGLKARQAFGEWSAF
jgi:hypothetical protein